MTNTTENLLPCGHCGALSRMISSHGAYRICCSACGIETLFQEKKRAIATWNNRVVEKPKWTSKTPTETGLYHLCRNGVIYTALITESITTDHPGYDENELYILYGSSFDYLGSVGEYPDRSEEYFNDGNEIDSKWLKIDFPAPPEEGAEI